MVEVLQNHVAVQNRLDAIDAAPVLAPCHPLVAEPEVELARFRRARIRLVAHRMPRVYAHVVRRGASIPRCGMWACLAPQPCGDAADMFCVFSVPCCGRGSAGAGNRPRRESALDFACLTEFPETFLAPKLASIPLSTLAITSSFCTLIVSECLPVRAIRVSILSTVRSSRSCWCCC